MTDYTGIQRRTDSRGRERCRGYVKQHGKRITGPWGSYSEARAWRIRTQAAILDGTDLAPAPKGQTIAEVAEQWLDGIERGSVLSRKNEPYASKTCRGYRQAFATWVNPQLGHIEVTHLRRDQVQRWVDWLMSQRESGTVRNTWAALAALYAYLLPRNVDVNDPTIGVQLPRPSKPRDRHADLDEIRQLLEVLPHDLAVPYALAFYAGLRRAEIQALPIDKVDLVHGWLRVQYALDPQTGFKGPKSGAGERDIPIFTPLRPYLETQAKLVVIEHHSTEDLPGSLLLPSKTSSKHGARMFGTPFTSRCREIWEARDLTPIGLHEARHSFGTWLARSGQDPKTVQEWMGHSQMSTTYDRYVKTRGRQPGANKHAEAYLLRKLGS